MTADLAGEIKEEGLAHLRDLADSVYTLKEMAKPLTASADKAAAELKQEMVLLIDAPSADRNRNGMPYVVTSNNIEAVISERKTLVGNFADLVAHGHTDLLLMAAQAGVLNLNVGLFRQILAAHQAPWADEMVSSKFVVEVTDAYVLSVTKQK